MTIIGIDPGASGGIAVLQDRDGLTTFKMPEDPAKIREIIHAVESPYVFVEKIPKWCGAGQFQKRNIFGASIASLYGQYKLCVGICYGLGIVPVEIPPQRWQKIVQCQNDSQPKLERTPWKNKLRDRAVQLFPGRKITLATSDAVLIAFAGRELVGMYA